MDRSRGKTKGKRRRESVRGQRRLPTLGEGRRRKGFPGGRGGRRTLEAHRVKRRSQVLIQAKISQRKEKKKKKKKKTESFCKREKRERKGPQLGIREGLKVLIFQSEGERSGRVITTGE